MNPIRNKVAIVGTGFSRVSRHTDTTVGQLAIEAGQTAVQDAGLTFDDIDGIANYPSPSRAIAGSVDGIDFVTLHFMTKTVPLRHITWASSANPGNVTTSLVDAVHAVACGACNYTLVYRAMFNPPARFGFTSTRRAGGDMQFIAPYGVGSVMAFAFAFSRYLSACMAEPARSSPPSW